MKIWQFVGAALVLAIPAATAQDVRPGAPPPQLRPVPRGPVLINDVQQAAVAKHPLTPYVEANTVAVADIDVAAIDVEAIANWLVELGIAEADSPQSRQVRAMVKSYLDQLKKSGVEHVYAMSSPDSWTDRGPVVVIPADDLPSVEGLVGLVLTALPKELSIASVKDAGQLLVGPQATLDRIRGKEAKTRPDLVLPLTADDRFDHLLVLSLPSDVREVLKDIWPERLPEGSPVELSPRQLVADIDRCLLGWNLPPDPQARLVLMTTDLAASARISGYLETLLQRVPRSADFFTLSLKETEVVIELRTDGAVRLLLEAINEARERAKQLQRANDLKQLGLAMHNYSAELGHLPPRVLVDPEGKPLLSGRVALLPYLEQQALHHTFRLDQAWDSPANQQVSSSVVPVYAGGSIDSENPSHTRMRFPVFPGSLWEGSGPPRRFQDITDGTSNTIAVIEAPASAATPWASPEPWVLPETGLLEAVFGDRPEVRVLMLDGSVRSLIRDEIDEATLKAMLTIAGGEAL